MPSNREKPSHINRLWRIKHLNIYIRHDRRKRMAEDDASAELPRKAVKLDSKKRNWHEVFAIVLRLYYDDLSLLETMEEFKEEFLYHDWERLAELPEEDQNNKDLIMMVVRRHGLEALKYANSKFTKDRDIIMAGIVNNPHSMRHLPYLFRFS